MNEQTLWGILISIYVIPFCLWLMLKHNDNDARKEAREKFYPGHVEEDRQDNRLMILTLLWGVGLAALLAAWKANWHPIGTAVILFGAMLLMLIVRFALRRWQ